MLSSSQRSEITRKEAIETASQEAEKGGWDNSPAHPETFASELELYQKLEEEVVSKFHASSLKFDLTPSSHVLVPTSFFWEFVLWCPDIINMN